MLKDQDAIGVTARLRRARLALVFAFVSGAALILAACGGGGGGGGTTPKTQFVEVPDTVAFGEAGEDINVGRQITELRGGLVNLPTPKIRRSPWPLGDPAAKNSKQTLSYAVTQTKAQVAHQTGAPDLSRSQRRGGNVRVAVVDSGFDVRHPDLVDSFLWRQGQDKAADNPVGRNFRLDADQDVNNVRPRTNYGRAGLSHGTHVAGIIAARDNSIGVLGIAPEAKILPMRFLTDGTPPEYAFGTNVQPGEKGFELNLGGLFQYARQMVPPAEMSAMA